MTPWILTSSSVIVSLLLLLPGLLKIKLPWKSVLFMATGAGFSTGLILVFVFSWFPFPKNWFFIIPLEMILTVSLIVAIVLYRFYRDPDRKSPPDEGLILAPADGTVRYVEHIRKGRLLVVKKGSQLIHLKEFIQSQHFSGDCIHIGIEMNVLDVHVNRAPIGGTIIYQNHISGKFLSLRKKDALTMNERLVTIIENKRLKVGVIQIASRLVRRITPFVKEKETVAIGSRIGMIRFGSQVDIVVPQKRNMRIRIKPGDRVKAGTSILIYY